MVVMAVLLVSLGRLGDIYGRVRMFNLGFAVFTAFSILLSVTWMHGSAGAIWLILMRVGQGIGASLLFANSSAILTDAFPPDQRGLALGVNSIAAIAGSFLGLVLGGVLAPVSWRLVFLVSVPIGLLATLWAYRSLRELGVRRPVRIDWWGNATGYDFAQTPLWAGIYMLPLIAGFLVAGPASGWLSDHFGARPFATWGMVLAALSFLLLIILPVDFSYSWFALILLLNGIGMGLFASPNSAGVMNSLPPTQRGAGAGILATFMNTASVLSIGVFFTLMIVGLAAALPHTLQSGLVAHGVPATDAARISHLPPVATLFASFLG